MKHPDPEMVPTPVGAARMTVQVGGSRGLVVLGHGAGGGLGSADLVAVTETLAAAGYVVVGVEQPYRVLGRRAPERAERLDAAWTAVVGILADRYGGGLVVGGRSSGARVACRTAADVGAAAVVCLAFPLHPPRRPDRSRAVELAAPQVPVLVVQGERDAFGGPAEVEAAVEPGRAVTVAPVPGDHSLRHSAVVAATVADWLSRQRLV